MNQQSVDAFNSGMAGLRAGLGDLRESRLKKEMLKRQLSQDARDEEDRTFMRTMRAKQIELAERGDKRDETRLGEDQARNAREDILKQIEAGRRAQETAAHTRLLDSQATAVAAKPPSPVAAQLAGVEDFSNNFAAALEENQAAMAEAAQKGTTTSRVLKAQIRLSALQQLSDSWKKNAEKEPTVDLEFPSEDGLSKMRLKVPQGQWNDRHPMWGRFMSTQQPGGGGAAAPAGGPPSAAIEMLRKNPAMAGDFDKKFGAGQAQKVLSGR